MVAKDTDDSVPLSPSSLSVRVPALAGGGAVLERARGSRAQRSCVHESTTRAVKNALSARGRRERRTLLKSPAADAPRKDADTDFARRVVGLSWLLQHASLCASDCLKKSPYPLLYSYVCAACLCCQNERGKASASEHARRRSLGAPKTCQPFTSLQPLL